MFFDLGGTLRICEENPEHQEKAKARMAELAGRADVKDFIDMVEARYAPYRDWALTENREAGDFELWPCIGLPRADLPVPAGQGKAPGGGRRPSGDPGTL